MDEALEEASEPPFWAAALGMWVNKALKKLYSFTQGKKREQQEKNVGKKY